MGGGGVLELAHISPSILQGDSNHIGIDDKALANNWMIYIPYHTLSLTEKKTVFNHLDSGLQRL